MWNGLSYKSKTARLLFRKDSDLETILNRIEMILHGGTN